MRRTGRVRIVTIGTQQTPGIGVQFICNLGVVVPVAHFTSAGLLIGILGEATGGQLRMWEPGDVGVAIATLHSGLTVNRSFVLTPEYGQAQRFVRGKPNG